MRVLVTGGAGYIGSHVVRELINSGHHVTVLDNLKNGHEDAIDPRANFINGSTANLDLLLQRLHAHQIEAVMHLATESDPIGSRTNPYRYYQNNFSNSLNLFYAMVKLGIKRLIYSSTCEVYGHPETYFIDESQRRDPLNPHARSSMMCEMAIEDFNSAYGLSFSILRYFNAAGASPDASIGEDHQAEHHLIPRIFKAAAENSAIKIYGTNYNTKDGTFIRDYVHVVDIARAFVLALENIKGGDRNYYNIGSESGFTIREIITVCEKIMGKAIQVIESQRKKEEPAILLANSQKIRKELNWTPLYPKIQTIAQHAWHWHSTHPTGYTGPIENIPSQRSYPSTPDLEPHRTVIGHG